MSILLTHPNIFMSPQIYWLPHFLLPSQSSDMRVTIVVYWYLLTGFLHFFDCVPNFSHGTWWPYVDNSCVSPSFGCLEV